MKVNNVQFKPAVPSNGLVGFVSFEVEDLFIGNIGVYTTMSGSSPIRLTYPTKKLKGGKTLEIVKPLRNKAFENILNCVLEHLDIIKFLEVHNEI